MKILHIAVVRKLSQGQRQQLVYETRAATSLSGTQWESIAFHAEPPQTQNERQIPRSFRPIFLRYLYMWITLLRLARNYDFVLCRYAPFDLFALVFGWFVRNRIPVYHAKSIAELPLIRPGWQGRAASIVERLTGWVTSKQIAGAVAVTNDIATYCSDLYKSVRNIHVYPNAIDPDLIPQLDDTRDSNRINAVFLSGVFSAWHGLDRLVASFRDTLPNPPQVNLRVHLIGTLRDHDLKSVHDLNAHHPIFVVHGPLRPAAYRPILAQCDVGLASFAMDREGLTEGATLKVREYLAAGLPVYSGHRDTAVPDDHRYYRVGLPDYHAISQFAEAMKTVSRESVRNASLPFIDKRTVLDGVVRWLAALQAPHALSR
jgi:glycosyltransferase involved in cell wall biosynthesis